MKHEMQPFWIAEDGTRFGCKELCEAYEREKGKMQDAWNAWMSAAIPNRRRLSQLDYLSALKKRGWTLSSEQLPPDYSMVAVISGNGFVRKFVRTHITRGKGPARTIWSQNGARLKKEDAVAWRYLNGIPDIVSSNKFSRRALLAAQGESQVVLKEMSYYAEICK